ncbi:membrane protein [Lactococcus phage RH6]|nr:membrane protein [Lactococcus phage RH6]QPL22607.1 membrane protein [Lactococcus phage FB10]
MNVESIIGKVVIIALVGIGLYAFFVLVDLIKTKGSK